MSAITEIEVISESPLEADVFIRRLTDLFDSEGLSYKGPFYLPKRHDQVMVDGKRVNRTLKVRSLKVSEKELSLIQPEFLLIIEMAPKGLKLGYKQA